MDMRRKSKMVSSSALDFRQRSLAKAYSDSSVIIENFEKSKEQNSSLEGDRLGVAEANRSAQEATKIRRCLINGDLSGAGEAPDLLQLFNIFRFNAPHLPPSRMLVNVTLEGSIQAVRLFVQGDASVQDVIKAALEAYIREGRIPPHGYQHELYCLHFSPFSLESIKPEVPVSTLGTRTFYLFQSRQPVPEAPKALREAKSWWQYLLGLW